MLYPSIKRKLNPFWKNKTSSRSAIIFHTQFPAINKTLPHRIETGLNTKNRKTKSENRLQRKQMLEFSDINFKIGTINMPKEIEEMMEKITRNWHLLKKNQSLPVFPH